jgi:hypothetical protein
MNNLSLKALDFHADALIRRPIHNGVDANLQTFTIRASDVGLEHKSNTVRSKCRRNMPKTLHEIRPRADGPTP